MSLINKMLRDLSARETRKGEVMSGIEVSAAGRKGSAPKRGRLMVLALLVAGFTALFWWALGHRVATAPTPVAAPVVASATRPPAAPPPRFQLDSRLTEPTGPARPREPRKHATRNSASASAAPAPEKRAASRIATAHEARAGGGAATTKEQELQAALARDPANHAAREALVVLLLDQNRLDEAAQQLDAGFALARGYLPYRRLSARLDLARGEPALAAKALEFSPPPLESDPEYHALLASAYQRIGKHEDAARIYQRLMQLQPEQAHWWVGYGLSRDALGDTQAALGAYARARTLGGLEPRVLEHIDQRSAALAGGG